MKKQKLLKLLGFSLLGLTPITTIITTSCGGNENDKSEQTNPIESIKFNKSSLTLEVGKSEQLKVTINPSNATDKKITWSSSNESIVTVDENGNVKAIKVGNAEVTATTSNGKSTICSAKVVGDDVNILNNYCVLKANEDSTFKFYQDAGHSNGKKPNLQYTQYIQGQNFKWQESSIDNEISITKDSTILLKGDNPNGWDVYDETGGIWTQNGNILIKGNVSLSGKINALLDNGKNSINTIPSRCFSSLFKDSTGITSIASGFLPSTSISSMCYNGLFNGCSSLKIAPDLPATTLYAACYNRMFLGCSSLETAPDLPAKKLVIDCYKEMFSHCSSLKSISIGYTGSYNDLYFNLWANDVNQNGGTFYYDGNSTLTSFKLPSSWTIQKRSN